MKKLTSTLCVVLASVSMANAAQYLQASSTITQCRVRSLRWLK